MSLPGVLGEIAEVAGDVAALKLARALGGTEIKLSARKGGKLARIVGMTEAKAIVEALGPQRIVVPMASLRGARARRETARRLMREGASSTEAALACDIHERTARRARQRKDPPMPLFPED